ncbi:MAG: citrate/2-methylcitrate synthase [Chloroflexota bacterium]|nr:citrate/2-methylcitrate synthase [Chloroflexota bacterium]
MSQRYLSAREVTEQLNITTATLYSYVSRGLIRSEETGTDHRARRYHAEDVERLRKRKAHRRDPGQVAQGALAWGEPVLESKLTLIADGVLYYRGQDAAQLARTHTFEQVAALLWTEDMESEAWLFQDAEPAPLPDMPPAQTWLAMFQTALALAAEHDLYSYDRSTRGMLHTGVRILQVMISCSAGTGSGSIAERLARAWDVNNTRLIDAALILCADHELNASSFAARVTASTGATPYQVVAAGLAALSGHKHGGHTERVAALLRELETQPDALATVIRARLQRGDGLPGFGHKLYPDGDPRAAALQTMMIEGYGVGAQYIAPLRDVQFARQVAEQVSALTGQHPTIDYELVALERALALPTGAAFALFALGRSAGWIAHAIEQYGEPELLRPRAKYTGVMPGR